MGTTEAISNTLITLLERVFDKRLVLLAGIWVVTKWLLLTYPILVFSPIWLIPAVATFAIGVAVLVDPKHQGIS